MKVEGDYGGIVITSEDEDEAKLLDALYKAIQASAQTWPVYLRELKDGTTKLEILL